MQTALKDKNDIKIFILYLLRHIGYPLDFNNINDIVVQDGMVNYFDFAECFAELLDTGNIVEVKHDAFDMYMITEQGIHVADNLESNLLGIIRDKSLKSALRLLSFKKRGAAVKCESNEMEDGRFRLSCTISEKNTPVLSLSVVLDNKSQLERMRYNFSDRPEVVYRGILALLSGEVNYLLE